MKGFIGNIEQIAVGNTTFRTVIYTSRHMQLVVMALLPLEDIGEETHTLDQFVRIEEGTGKVVLDGVEYPIGNGSAVVVPAGTRHNFINTSPDKPMKLYTIYAPPDHLDGTIHQTKADAMAQDLPFDGKTTE